MCNVIILTADYGISFYLWIGHSNADKHGRKLQLFTVIVEQLDWAIAWHSGKHTTQAGWFLRPDCAPSSECPQFRMPRASIAARRWFNQNIPPSVVLLQQCHCRNRHRGKLQNLSPPSVLFKSSRISFTIHRRHRCRKRWTRILKFKFCDFWEFFEIFKKASRGPSAADLDHYGRGQTRSE